MEAQDVVAYAFAAVLVWTGSGVGAAIWLKVLDELRNRKGE